MYKIIKSKHLTAHDKRLIIASINNNLQDVATPKKRLIIISQDAENNVKANLYSYQVGLGIGAKSSWHRQEIEFEIQ